MNDKVRLDKQHFPCRDTGDATNAFEFHTGSFRTVAREGEGCLCALPNILVVFCAFEAVRSHLPLSAARNMLQAIRYGGGQLLY